MGALALDVSSAYLALHPAGSLPYTAGLLRLLAIQWRMIAAVIYEKHLKLVFDHPAFPLRGQGYIRRLYINNARF